MTHMYFSAEGRVSYGHLGRTNSCLCRFRLLMLSAYRRLLNLCIFDKWIAVITGADAGLKLGTKSITERRKKV